MHGFCPTVTDSAAGGRTDAEGGGGGRHAERGLTDGLLRVRGKRARKKMGKGGRHVTACTDTAGRERPSSFSGPL